MAQAGGGKLRVSYLGPEATFTHEAALRHFGPEAEFLPAGSIAAVFDEVEARGGDSQRPPGPAHRLSSVRRGGGAAAHRHPPPPPGGGGGGGPAGAEPPP